MRKTLMVLGAALLLAACAAPQMTPELVSQLAYESLGPEMQMGDQMLTVWVPAAPKPADGTPPLSPEATVALAAASSPMVTDLAR